MRGVGHGSCTVQHIIIYIYIVICACVCVYIDIYTYMLGQNANTRSDSLRGSSVDIGTMQRRLAWPLRKDDTHTSRSENANTRWGDDARTKESSRSRFQNWIKHVQTNSCCFMTEQHSIWYVIVIVVGSPKGGGTSATSNWYAQNWYLWVIPGAPSCTLYFVCIKCYVINLSILGRQSLLIRVLLTRGGDY